MIFNDKDFFTKMHNEYILHDSERKELYRILVETQSQILFENIKDEISKVAKVGQYQWSWDNVEYGAARAALERLSNAGFTVTQDSDSRRRVTIRWSDSTQPAKD